MDPINEANRQLTRREFFVTAARGLGGVALAGLLSPNSFSKPYSGLSALPHFAPKAKRNIPVAEWCTIARRPFRSQAHPSQTRSENRCPNRSWVAISFSSMTNTKEKLLCRILQRLLAMVNAGGPSATSSRTHQKSLTIFVSSGQCTPLRLIMLPALTTSFLGRRFQVAQAWELG